MLKDLNWKVCLIYLDDIIVYGAVFYAALDHIKMVWAWIPEASLKLKLTKLLDAGPGAFLWPHC